MSPDLVAGLSVVKYLSPDLKTILYPNLSIRHNANAAILDIAAL